MALKMKWHCSRNALSDCIKGEEWKIDMITDILDCINGIYESNLNEEENLFLLNDLCTLKLLLSKLVNNCTTVLMILSTNK